LTNANLDVNGNLINMSDGQVQNIGRLQYTEPSWPSDDNMDITAVGSDPPELVVRHYDFDGGGTEDIATFKGGSNTKLQFEGGRLDMNGNAIVDSNTGKVEFFDTVQASWFNATSGGPSGTGILNFSNTSLFEDNGEVVGRDSNGNTTQLT